ncbi:MAG: hypothetical protein NT092_12775 [Bacteroidia bacterium]|nr:hypothetical protein [Bacteroidia bacterium]
MKKTFLTGFLLLLLSVFALAQDFVLPDLIGFRKITDYPVYVPGNLWDFIDGAADTYLALGFVDLNVAEYRKGKDVIKLEIYRHSDHIMAFGIYASERSSSYNFNNLGSQGYIVDGAINFFKGNYYVKLRTYSKKSKTLQSEESLARIVESLLAGETDMPLLLSRFPDEGKKTNEETFVNESVLGHQFLNNAFKAVYQTGNDNFSVYIIKSGSAEETLKTAKAYLAAGGIEPDQSETRYVFTDGYNGTTFLTWKESLMVIISGLARDQADIAEKYSSEILK